jgi:hypothetical protein
MNILWITFTFLDSETLGVSLPSYQPVSAGCEHSRDAELKNEKSFCINDGLDEEQQGKDNSRCDSSSAESSDSVNSEDLKKPMSAAARYLLKVQVQFCCLYPVF